MGNDASQLKGLEIDEKPLESTDFWYHYKATIKDSCRYFGLRGDGSVSVFKGEVILGPLWTVSTPLEKFCNNILKYRHPFIIRYLSAWQQRSTFHLATEFVQPLSHLIGSQTPLQKCIGLNNILQALVFLHEQGGVSHNNISVSSIYVSGDGQWKLGGLQYLCSFTDLTPSYLKQARIHRYDKAIDPNEENNQLMTKVDQYAFANLVEEVFQGCKDDEVPHLKEFKLYCKNSLQNTDCKQRPNLSEVLRHNFFNHEFISMYKFLSFLPLKGNDEKKQFFLNILKSLECYDEETVAKQFGGLLLSRLTLLDETARKNVIPYILRPKNGRTLDGEPSGFFGLNTFKEYLKPRLIQLFSVRDIQIRMILLTHFSKYVNVFSHEELTHHILPELLLGIKDTDDTLVSATLVCLSELVPILGADTVVGGKRSKLFTDGRPKSNSLVNKNSSLDNETHCLQNKYIEGFKNRESNFCNEINSSMFDEALILHERPSPVGGESIDELASISCVHKKDDSEDDWDDWENTNNQINAQTEETSNSHIEGSLINSTSLEKTILSNNVQNEESKAHSVLLQRAAINAKKNIVDITDLDIKNKIDQSKKNSDEFDFFADMTPVIEKPKVALIKDDTDVSSKLNFVPENEEDGNEGWEDTWND